MRGDDEETAGEAEVGGERTAGKMVGVDTGEDEGAEREPKVAGDDNGVECRENEEPDCADIGEVLEGEAESREISVSIGCPTGLSLSRRCKTSHNCVDMHYINIHVYGCTVHVSVYASAVHLTLRCHSSVGR